MRGKGLILGTLCLAALILNLDTTIVKVALPTLVREIGATRLFGGTLGVAVIGSVAASPYTSRLASLVAFLLPARPGAVRPDTEIAYTPSQQSQQARR